jgi:hypothetical protein
MLFDLRVAAGWMQFVTIFGCRELWCINRFDSSGELRAVFGETPEVAAKDQRYLIES